MTDHGLAILALSWYERTIDRYDTASQPQTLPEEMSTFKLDDVVALLHARVAALPVAQIETDAEHIGVQLECVVAAAKNAQAMADATQRCRALFLRVMERIA